MRRPHSFQFCLLCWLTSVSKVSSFISSLIPFFTLSPSFSPFFLFFSIRIGSFHFLCKIQPDCHHTYDPWLFSCYPTWRCGRNILVLPFLSFFFFLRSSLTLLYISVSFLFHFLFDLREMVTAQLSNDQNLMAGILVSLASGSFLYISLIEILPTELHKPRAIALKLVAMIFGWFAMVVLAFYA